MIRAAVALLLAVVVAPEVGSPVRSQPALAARVTLPFELVMRHVIVKVRVNGSRPLSFVLDTGANTAIVRMPIANELGLSLEGNVTTGGAGPGTQAGKQVRNARWSLVGLETFSQPVSLALPLPLLPSGLGCDVDGIIGGEFIRQFVVQLDYQARTITLHDPQAFAYAGGGSILPLDFTRSGHPVVSGIVTPAGGPPIEHRFLLDIGSGGALVLHSPFAAEHGLPRADDRTIRAIGMAGAGGAAAGRLGRVQSLQLGPFTIDRPFTMFSQDQAGAFSDRSLAGNIGAQIARRFRLVFDYSRRRLILEQAPAFAEPFDRAFSGLAVRAEGSDYRTFRVDDVLEDSPATEAGIRKGDVITGIDDTPADRFTLTTLNELLDRQASHEVTLRRADQSITVTLTPRRLV
jgi:aspartyl protease/PDZ domain-containing protein